VKAVKIFAILFLVYVGIVAAFESLLGYFQPAGQSTLVITTTDDDGSASDRVLSRLESNGHVYVSVNHWPRAWYHRALDNPNVQVTLDGDKGDYVAVSVTGEEYDRVSGENKQGAVFRILTGFPPRHLVRLDPIDVP
jgi:hypothetical protein